MRTILTNQDGSLPDLNSHSANLANPLVAVDAATRRLLVSSDGGSASASAPIADATLVTPAQIVKTVAATATPEAIAADGTFFRRATIIGNKAARTLNTGDVYIGPSSADGSQPFVIGPGESITLDAFPGTKQDLNDWYVDVLNAGDGVVVIYSA